MSDDPLAEIHELIERAKAEGKEVQIGESECAFCHTDLGDNWHTLRLRLRDQPPMLIRLCEPCAIKFDIDTGIFGLVREG